MKPFFGFLAIIAFANALIPGLRVKFGISDGFGESNFYRVATTVQDAIKDGWKQYQRPAGPLPQLTMCCPEEKNLCVLFDDTGYIAGVQVALKDTFTNNPFDPAIQGFTKWDTYIDGKRTSLWTHQQYFVSEEALNQSKESRLNSRNSSRILQEGGVWLTGIHGQLLKVSTNEQDIRKSTFKEQGCMSRMGLHYYNNMSKTTECIAEQIFPWSIMTYQGELVATALTVFGQMPVEKGKREWFERSNSTFVKMNVPYAPDCLYNLSDNPGVITMHIYYTDDPRIITC